MMRLEGPDVRSHSSLPGWQPIIISILGNAGPVYPLPSHPKQIKVVFTSLSF